MNWKKISREKPCETCGGLAMIWEDTFDPIHGVSVPVDRDCPACNGTGSQGIKKNTDQVVSR